MSKIPGKSAGTAGTVADQVAEFIGRTMGELLNRKDALSKQMADVDKQIGEVRQRVVQQFGEYLPTPAERRRIRKTVTRRVKAAEASLTLGGVLVLGASIAASGLATRLWHLYLIQGVGVACGLAATGPVVGSAVISRWFVKRRATALSLVGSAWMAGISALVPIVTWCILTLGWRGAFGVLGLAVVAVGAPLALWVVRDSPESVGLSPDGARPDGVAVSAAGERTPIGAAVSTLPFWHLGGALFSCGFSMSLIASHGVPMLTDHGYHPMMASWALISSTLGKSRSISSITFSAACFCFSNVSSPARISIR